MNYYIYTMKLVSKYLKKYPAYFLWMGVRVIYIASEVANPIILGIVINILTKNPAIEGEVVFYIGLYLASIVFGPILEVWTAHRAWYIAHLAGKDFRDDMVNLLKHTGLNFWADKSKGGILTVIDRAYTNFVEITGSLSHVYLWALGRIVGMFLASVFVTPFIMLVFAVDMALFLLNLFVLVPKEQRAGHSLDKSNEGVNSGINEYLQNFKTVVYLNLFKRQEKDVAYKNEVSFKKYEKAEFLSALKWYNNNQLHALAWAVVFGYGVFELGRGNLNIGQLTTMMFFMSSFADNLSWVVWEFGLFIRRVNSLQRYSETFGSVKKTPNIDKSENDINFQKLSIQNLSVEREGRETLSKMNFEIKKGQKVAIVGYTGSGKSTLLDTILKVITDYKGKVKLNNFDYKKLKVVDIANIFSVVPQEVQLFKDTIKGNILASNPNFQGDLNKILKICSLDSLIKKLPDGVDQELYEGTANLSGGERQRIGIARSLVQGQPILVLDEATASLDPKTEKEVVTSIIKNYPQMTMLYVTHKYSLLSNFDYILVINEGKIIQQGSFSELKNKDGLFKDLYEASLV